MTLDRATSRNPIGIGAISIALHDNPLGETPQHGDFNIEVVYDDGSTHAVSGNLVPHLSATQIQRLSDFLDSLRAQAETEILPE